jgi:hypothetical protein
MPESKSECSQDGEAKPTTRASATRRPSYDRMGLVSERLLVVHLGALPSDSDASRGRKP